MRNLIVVLFLFPMALYSQSEAAEWKAIKGEAKDSILNLVLEKVNYKNLDVEYKIATYSTHESSVVEDVEIGRLIVDNENSWNSILGLESISNGSYSLTINKSVKEITLAQIDVDHNNSLQEGWRRFLTKDAIILRNLNNPQLQLKIQFPKDSEFEFITLSFNEQNVVKKIVYYFGYGVQHDPLNPLSPITKPRLEIEFDNLVLNASPLPANKKISGILNTADAKIKLSKTFADYKLIDTRLHVSK